MKLQFAPSTWACLPTSFAMVLDMPVYEVIKRIGHDGSEILWPHLSDPLRRRAFSLQELVDVCVSEQRFPVQVDADAAYGPDYDVDTLCDPFPDARARIERYLHVPSVLIGLGERGNRHAVAWNPAEQLVYDPDGFVTSIDKYQLEHVIALF